MGGREQAPELWCLTPLSLDAEGRVLPQRPQLDEREFMELTFAIEPVFLKADLRVQIWDTSWFLTRRKDWALIAAPAMALPGLALDEAPLEGEATGAVRKLLAEVRDILAAPRQRSPPHGRQTRRRRTLDFWRRTRAALFSPHAHSQRRVQRRSRARLGQRRRHSP